MIVRPDLAQYITERGSVEFPVVMEDKPLHTAEKPFCSEVFCPCHEVVTGDPEQNEIYHRLIVEPLLAGKITATEANDIFFNRHE